MQCFYNELHEVPDTDNALPNISWLKAYLLQYSARLLSGSSRSWCSPRSLWSCKAHGPTQLPLKVAHLGVKAGRQTIAHVDLPSNLTLEGLRPLWTCIWRRRRSSEELRICVLGKETILLRNVENRCVDLRLHSVSSLFPNRLRPEPRATRCNYILLLLQHLVCANISLQYNKLDDCRWRGVRSAMLVSRKTLWSLNVFYCNTRFSARAVGSRERATLSSSQGMKEETRLHEPNSNIASNQQRLCRTCTALPDIILTGRCLIPSFPQDQG